MCVPKTALLIFSTLDVSIKTYIVFNHICKSWWYSGTHFVDFINGQICLSITSASSTHLQVTEIYYATGKGTTLFLGLLHFTLDTYLIMLSVKQGNIKYHFLSLWYDLTWDWTLVSKTIGKHSTQLANTIVLINSGKIMEIPHFRNSDKNYGNLYVNLLQIDLPIWIVTDTTTLGLSGLGSNGNEGVLHTPQSSRTGASWSDSFVSYPEHSLGGRVTPWQRYFTAPANWVATHWGSNSLH